MFLARQSAAARYAVTLCRIQANYENKRATSCTFRRKNLGTWFGAGAAPYLFPLGEDSVSEGDTRAIVRELYDAYGRRDFERVAALIHDDIDWVIYAPMSVFPFAGSRHGRAAVLAAMADIAKAFALEAYNPDVMIVEGERAALMSIVSYRQRATGRVLRVRIASFLRLQDGRLVEYREFIDSFDAVEQALGRELQL
jgi:ketosteroid isomerase-like protein